jgi:hypothetical protein
LLHELVGLNDENTVAFLPAQKSDLPLEGHDFLSQHHD